MAIEDAPLIENLIEEGVCLEPAFLPEWLLDERALSDRVARAQARFPFHTDSAQDMAGETVAPGRRRARAAVGVNAALALDEDEDES
jgi:hypothetical protein